MNMKKSLHRNIHIKLHESLDQLLADFIAHKGELVLDKKVVELLEWSYKQTIEPDELVIKYQ